MHFLLWRDEGLATSAYAPEQLQPVTKLPADFRDYWAKTLEEARKTPLNPLMTLLPERCTETDNVYQVSFQTKAWGGRFYGILSIPKKEGPLPCRYILTALARRSPRAMLYSGVPLPKRKLLQQKI